MRSRFLACFGFFLIMTGASATQVRSKGDVKRGEEVFKSLCWTCHGNYGRGDGPAGKYLAYPPPDLTDPRVFGKRTDLEIVSGLVDTKGQTGASHRTMVIGDVLKKEALQDAIAYMRSLSLPGKHVSISAGKDIYDTFCSACHGAKGNGRGPAAKNLTGAKPRDFTSKNFVIEGHEEQIKKTIFEGAAKTFHGSPYMPEWKTTLTEQQIADIVEYIKTLKKQ
jgi:mono/diheme cytochrome c family protein